MGHFGQALSSRVTADVNNYLRIQVTGRFPGTVRDIQDVVREAIHDSFEEFLPGFRVSNPIASQSDTQEATPGPESTAPTPNPASPPLMWEPVTSLAPIPPNILVPSGYSGPVTVTSLAPRENGTLAWPLPPPTLAPGLAHAPATLDFGSFFESTFSPFSGEQLQTQRTVTPNEYFGMNDFDPPLINTPNNFDGNWLFPNDPGS